MVAMVLANDVKIEERRAKRQPWKLNIFRVQEEEEEETVEGVKKVIRMVEILTNINHEPVCFAGINTVSFMIIGKKKKKKTVSENV